MEREISPEQAKNLALTLISGMDFGNYEARGFSLSKEAGKIYDEIGKNSYKLLYPVNNSRKSPSGFPFDFYADSAWHALCALSYQKINSHIGTTTTYSEAKKNMINSFGRRPFYRGQTRAWDILPSAWRSKEIAESSGNLIKEFQQALKKYISKYPDLIDSTIRRENLENVIEGLAQHYQLPTNLIDMSFNPLVAVTFACSDSSSSHIQPRELNDEKLINCAVVYSIAIPAMFTISKAAFEFPPAYSKRLYEQRGMFVNFGPYPEKNHADYSDTYNNSWNWLQQNCQRIFFKRTYPIATNVEEIHDNNLMEGDPFLIDLSKKILANISSNNLDYDIIPPWYSNNKNEIDSNSDILINHIDTYIRESCLVKFEDEDVLDPILFSILYKHLEPEIEFLLFIAEQKKHPGLKWIATRIIIAKEALILLKEQHIDIT
jgi:hypothetical protein